MDDVCFEIFAKANIDELMHHDINNMDDRTLTWCLERVINTNFIRLDCIKREEDEVIIKFNLVDSEYNSSRFTIEIRGRNNSVIEIMRQLCSKMERISYDISSTIRSKYQYEY